MKLANPLHYPLAVLVGGAALVVSVRLLRLPNVVGLPLALGTTLVAAQVRQGQEPEPVVTLNNPSLQQELEHTRRQALDLQQQAGQLLQEAQALLTAAHELELLATVQYACDRTQEIPAKVDQLARQLAGGDSLLSVQALEQQLARAQQKQRQSQGAAQEQWGRVVNGLQRNIRLARQGKDAREAQVVSLSTLILDASGVLQNWQNSLRSSDLNPAATATELRSLSTEFTHLQEQMDLLISGSS